MQRDQGLADTLMIHGQDYEARLHQQLSYVFIATAVLSVSVSHAEHVTHHGKNRRTTSHKLRGSIS